MQAAAVLLIAIIIFAIVIVLYEFKAELAILEIRISWLSIGMLIISFVVSSIVLYSIYVHTLEWKHIKTLVISVYAAINYCALFLSWYFFNKTHCYDYEGNTVLQNAYFKYGEDFPHLVIFILRTALVIILGYILLGDLLLIDASIEMFGGHLFYTTITIYSINTAIFTVELFSNIWSNMNPPADPCKYITEYCKEFGGIWCDQPNMK